MELTKTKLDELADVDVKKDMTPTEFFAAIKNSVGQITENDIKTMYQSALSVYEKLKACGQEDAITRLQFQMYKMITGELPIVRMGFNRYVLKDDIEEFLTRTTTTLENDKRAFPIKSIELSRFPRLLPDDIIKTVEATKDIFDNFYILFTDYTNAVEKQVAQENRDKDPILFGAFEFDGRSAGKPVYIMDRFYYLGDWEDEYCDLTLPKMIEEAAKYTDKQIVHDIPDLPQTEEEVIEAFDMHNPIFLSGKKDEPGIYLSAEEAEKAAKEASGETSPEIVKKSHFFANIGTCLKNLGRKKK